MATSSRRDSGRKSKTSKSPKPPERPFENIEALLEDGGEITVGGIASVRCAATAADEDICYAMLQRRNDETFVELLQRLDDAIARAWEENLTIDEIDPP